MSIIDRTFRLTEDASGRGVTCTLDGVTLAGVPLLRFGIHGLEPRSANEITGLVKAAYGSQIDPTTVLRGLSVVADALNKGDVGRAMIATVHLRLPDTDGEGADRIAKAQSSLAKYDPNEPRDERGRWTTGDASGDGAGRASLIPVSDFEPANENIPKAIRDKFDEVLRDPRIINHIFASACVNNIQGGDYYDKAMECKAANEKCEYLVKLGERNLKRQDICIYPDGAMVMARGGFLIPLKLGRKW